MKIILRDKDVIKELADKDVVTIGSKDGCDFLISDISEECIKFVYSVKYKSYVVININKDSKVLLNNKTFSKMIAPEEFVLSIADKQIYVSVKEEQNSAGLNKIFENEIEKDRIAIVKEIGYKIQELKNNISSLGLSLFVLNLGIFLLSVICSFGMTNFLLGLKVNNNASVLNLTTNAGFWAVISIIVLSAALVLKNGVYSVLEFEKIKKRDDKNSAGIIIVSAALLFMLVVYAINLFYYKDIPGFGSAALFISLFFAGGLCAVSAGSGYIRFLYRNYNYDLMDSEFRQDFETVIKKYMNLIYSYINNLSQNKIENIRSSLINNQMKMVLEVIIGILTSPFLAYGVSNTLASCFPEAANWVRISGLRFSPIFLVLATFLIIFAFFCFVRAFSIDKQIKNSETIKFDGFHDYNSHGVTIFGIDAIRSLKKEKNTVMFIACFIIMIEFTMNVSYFITEIGGDLQGMFLSLVTALVPTALLIAETHLLSSTMSRINNYSDLLSMLD